MSRLLVIGLHGPMGSGKDTLARGLLEYSKDHLMGARFKFAEALYDMAAAFDPAFHPDMPQEEKSNWVLDIPSLGTRRHFLEKLGTEFGREQINQRIWLIRLQTKLVEFSKAGGELALVTDVRFENEATLIREHGVLVHLDPEWIEGTGSSHPSAGRLPIKPLVDEVLFLRKGQISEGISALTSILEERLGWRMAK